MTLIFLEATVLESVNINWSSSFLCNASHLTYLPQSCISGISMKRFFTSTLPSSLNIMDSLKEF